MTPEAFIPTEPIIRSEVTDPATVAALQNFGINPVGKSIEEIENEINAILAREQRRVVFDPTDPLDYLSTGLTLSGIGTGAGLGIKGLRMARKAGKLGETLRMGNMLKGSLAALNPLKVTKTASQGRIVPRVGPPVPLTTTATRTQVTPKIPQSLLISGEVVQAQDVAAAERQADKIQESLDEITASNAINTQPEGSGEDIDDSVTQTEETETKGGEEQKPELGDTKIENGKTYIYTAAGYVLMPNKSQPSVSELFRKKNINRFLRNVGAALVETGDFTGLAKGAAKAAEERAAEELATSLAQIEAGGKSAIKPELKYKMDQDYITATSKISENATSLNFLNQVENILSQKSVTGFRNLFKQYGYNLSAIVDPNTPMDAKTEVENLLREISIGNAEQVLGQSSGRLSDKDIELARELVGALEGLKGLTTTSDEILSIMAKRRADIERDQAKQGTIYTRLENDYFRYGTTPPATDLFRILDSLNNQTSGQTPSKNQEVERIPLQEPKEESIDDQFATSR